MDSEKEEGFRFVILELDSLACLHCLYSSHFHNHPSSIPYGTCRDLLARDCHCICQHTGRSWLPLLLAIVELVYAPEIIVILSTREVVLPRLELA